MKRLIAYLGAGLTMIVLWVFLVYTPYGKERAEQISAANAAKAQLTDFDNLLTKLPAFLETSYNLESARTDLESRLYAKGDILRLFDHVSQMARDNRLTMVEMAPRIAELLELNSLLTASDQPLFVNIDLRVKGRFRDIGRFMAQLESTQFFRGIKKCEIKAAERKADGLVTLVQFKALVGSPTEES